MRYADGRRVVPVDVRAIDIADQAPGWVGRPLSRRWPEGAAGGIHAALADREVPPCPDGDADPERNLSTENQDPLLRPLLGDEVVSEDLVDPEDLVLRDLADDPPAPVLTRPARSLLHDPGATVTQQDGQDQGPSALEVVDGDPMDLRNGQREQCARLEERRHLDRARHQAGRHTLARNERGRSSGPPMRETDAR